MVVPLPVEPVTAAGAALFGKLPSHGDFIARGLDAPDREALDAWLSDALATAVRELQDRFDTAHELAPAWRFVAPEAALGAGWSAGALAPSMDRAGRRFFILLAAAGLSPAEAACRGPALAEAMEGLIYDALATGMDADGLHRAAVRRIGETLPADGAAPGEAQPAWWVVDASGAPAVTRAARPADPILTGQTPATLEMAP